jgi:hypothetical protein
LLTLPQLDAGRDVPPPPDYQGMVEEVRREVAYTFGQPAPAEKPAGKKSRTPAPPAAVVEVEADEGGEEEEDEDEDDVDAP